MNDQEKTKQQLIAELGELRERVAASEGLEAERKRAEEALRASEERAQLLLNTVRLGIYDCDTNGVILWVNSAAERMTGHARNQLIGTHVWDRMEPGPPKDSLAAYLKHLAVEQPVPSPYFAEIITKDGRSIDLQVDWSYKRDTGGQIRGFVCVVSDITARKQAEAALQASEENFRKVFEEGPLGIALVGLDARIEHVNRHFCEMLGYSEGEIIALGIKGITHQDDWEKDRHYGSRLRRDEIPCYTIEKRYVRKDGQVIWGQLTVSMMHDAQGRPTTIIGMVEDITERKRTETALQESESRFRSLFQDSAIGTVVVTPDGNLVKANNAFCDFLGYSEPELLGQTVQSITHPEDREAASKARHQALTSGPRLHRFDKRYLHKNGQVLWGEVTSTLICDAHGKPSYCIGQVLDITERKRAEEELAKSKAILQATIECLPFDFFAIGADGHYMVENAVCRAHWGRLVGKTPEEMAPTEDVRALWSDNNRRAFAGEKVEDVVAVTIKGEERFVYNILTPIRDETHYYGILGVNIDITARKRAEEALQKAHDELERRVEKRTAELREANEHLRIFHMFMEASGQGFGMADLDGYITYWNPTLCRFFGEDTPENVVGKHVSAYYPKEYVEKRKNEILPAVMRDGHWQGELVVYSHQGKATPILQNTFLIRDDKGNPLRLAAAITDITERKRGEEALQTSEQKYRTLVETSPDGVIMTDLKGHVTYASGPVLEYFGTERVEDLLGRNPLDFIAKEDHHRFLDNLRRTVEDGITRDIEYESLRKDGTHFPVEISAAVISDVSRKPYALVAILRDITERKQMQKALRASIERYELAVRGAGVGIFDWNMLTGKVYYSPRWKTLFGYEEKDIGNSVEDWTRLLHPDERDLIVERQDEFFAGTSPTATAEYRLRHKDGSYRWIKAHVLVVRDENGRACRLVGSHEDITERKQAKEALERERQTLWRMLQASDHERQIISYDIHDGLAQYLAAATMQFQAHDAFRENSPDKAKKAYETAVELLRQAHFESRRLISEVRPPVIDESGLETAISHLVHEQRWHGGPKIHSDINVEFHRLPSILENSLYRIAQEALANACNHSKSKEVKVTLAQEGQEVRLEVQDWGIGFDQESVEEGHFGVEGIRQRVRLLGGRLKIESKPNSGTLVQVVVPVVEKKSEE